MSGSCLLTLRSSPGRAALYSEVVIAHRPPLASLPKTASLNVRVSLYSIVRLTHLPPRWLPALRSRSTSQMLLDQYIKTVFVFYLTKSLSICVKADTKKSHCFCKCAFLHAGEVADIGALPSIGSFWVCSLLLSVSMSTVIGTTEM